MIQFFDTHKIFRRLKLLIICFCLFSGLHSQTLQNLNNDILYWSENHRLNFDDFEGKPNKEDTSLHEISPKMLTHKLGTIIKSINVHLETEQSKTTFTIYTAMKKSSSWLKDKADSTELNHEQGHFDICEIYALLLRRDIKSAKSLSE